MGQPVAVNHLWILFGQGWRMQQIIQHQEPVNKRDLFGCHAYTIIKFSHEDHGENCFARIDYGCDGLGIQVGGTDKDFVRYCVQAQQNEVRSRLRHGRWLVGGFGGTLGTAVGAVLGVVCGGVALATGVGAAVGLVALPALSTAVARSHGGILAAMMKEVEYVDVKVGVTLEDTIKLIAQNALKEYNLRNWNCNHFSASLVQLLVDNPPARNWQTPSHLAHIASHQPASLRTTSLECPERERVVWTNPTWFWEG